MHEGRKGNAGRKGSLFDQVPNNYYVGTRGGGADRRATIKPDLGASIQVVEAVAGTGSAKKLRVPK
jgi:hypothetical protein